MKVFDELCCLPAWLLKLQVSLLVPGNYQGPKRISQTKMYEKPGVPDEGVVCVGANNRERSGGDGGQEWPLLLR